MPPCRCKTRSPQAVLAREDVARYLQGGHDGKGPSARERVETYLDEMRTTQRHAIYKALKHPLYPILRKVDRLAEGIEHVRAATAAGRVVYISNHKSHLDYVLEPLALEDFEIRPPVIAAGINLFGGPLGVINRHVTGAIPIRRNTKDPVYLATLKAYVAEVLRRHDVFFYIEGGRSYTGEFKAPKTGLVHAALQAEVPGPARSSRSPSPTTWCSRTAPCRGRASSGASGRSAASWPRWSAPRSATRRARSPASARRSRSPASTTTRAATCSSSPTWSAARIGRAAQGAADRARRRGDAAVEPAARSARRAIAELVDGAARARSANLDETDPQEIMERGVELLVDRDAMAIDDGLYRVRDRTLLRYYARSLAHLIDAAAPAAGARGVRPLMLNALSKAFFLTLASNRPLKRLASRYGLRKPTSFARRFIAGETTADAIEAARVVQAAGLFISLDLLGESVRHARRSRRRDARLRRADPRHRRRRHRAQRLAQADAARARRRSRHRGRQPAQGARRSPTATTSSSASTWRGRRYTEETLDIWETLWGLGHRRLGVVLQSALRRSEADAPRVIELGGRIRLVKGAYKEPKAIAYQSKADVDDAFVRMMRTAPATDADYPAIATHDPAMIAATKARADGARARPPIASSSRCCTASGATCRRRWPPRATGSASTSRSAANGSRTSCGASANAPPTSPSSSKVCSANGDTAAPPGSSTAVGMAAMHRQVSVVQPIS